MSAEQTTDHAKHAREHLAAGWDDRGEPNYRWWIDQAEVHATLAVAAEQRTANLIALLAVYEQRIPADSAEEHEDRMQQQRAVEQQLRDRLGLPGYGSTS